MEIQQQKNSNNNLDLINFIVKILKSHQDGITIQNLMKILQEEGHDQKNINQSIQFLSKNNHISIQSSGDLQILKYQNQEDLQHLNEARNKLSQDEYKVYECIFNSKKKGVDKREIDHQTGIFSGIVTKVLKNLEKLSIIKGVKGLKARSKGKVYLKFDIEIDNDIEGAAIFMKEGKIDDDLIKKYTSQIIEEIENNSKVSLDKLTSCLRVIDSNLDTSAVQRLVNLLIFDDVVEEIKSDIGGQSMYQLCNWVNVKNRNLDPPPLTKTPCGHCTLIYECRPGGIISPENCVYFENFADW